MNSPEIIHADGLRWMEERAPVSLHCIITDCPYPSLEKHRSVGTTTRLGGHRNEEKRGDWFDVISNADIYDFLCGAHRALVPDAHLWMICDGETAGYIQGFVREGETGFKYVKQSPILKCAASGGVKQGMGGHGRATHEYAVLCEKGRRKFSENNWPDWFTPVWDGASDSRQYTPDGQKFPTAKPVALYERLIELSSAIDELIADPFCGSGTLAQAALGMGRRAICVDKSDYAIRTSRNRVSQFYERQHSQLIEPVSAAEMSRVRRARLHALPFVASNR